MRFVVGVLALLFAAQATAVAQGVDVGGYPLDGISRVLADGEELPCKKAQLVSYRGTTLKLSKAARVHPAFVPKLMELERLVAEVAVHFYGRAPRTLVHLGTHNCRRMRRYPDWVSEHALGNAIDVAGFDFPVLPRGAELPEGVSPSLRRPQAVRLDRHWNAAHGPGITHSAFLRALAQRLIDRPDLFRVVLGPAWPGHHNHFHLDFAPYRVVEVFEASDAS